MAFCSQLIIDADYNDDGWEIAFRFDSESMEDAYSDLTDEQLPGVVGAPMAKILILERDNKQRKSLVG